MESLKKRNDRAGLERTQKSYEMFLKSLVASKSGQTFQSLRWAADNLLKLGSAREANEVYTTIINTYSKDSDFLKNPNALEMLMVVRLKQVAALRESGNLSESESLLNEVIKENKRSLEAQMELGYLLDAQAEEADKKNGSGAGQRKAAIKKGEARNGKWIQAYTHWKGLAMKLTNMNPKPIQYYEAWYQAAEALDKHGDHALARTTLASVMKLSPALGSPEMKAKYQNLLNKLGR